jgi:hypothetical protein
MHAVKVALYRKITGDSGITTELGAGRVSMEYPATAAVIPSIVVTCSDEGPSDGYTPKADETYQIDIRAATSSQRDRLVEMVMALVNNQPLDVLDRTTLLPPMKLDGVPSYQPNPIDAFRTSLSFRIITVPQSL